MSLQLSRSIKKGVWGVGLVALALLAGVTVWLWPKTEALSPWNAGRIIDDKVFYDTSTFASVHDVQKFLDSKTPQCDTWGTGPSEYGGGTRAQYARSRGWPGPPYVCLQNYHENPTTKETSFEKGGAWFAGGLSAAQIIWDAAREFQINPQVLIIMLKKEQGALFTDPWPTKSQYKYAMGFACPDTGPGNTANCSDEFAGFYNQIRMAARQLRRYAQRPHEYRYKAGRSNYIQYSTDTSCGGSWVFIENQATASLYNYTPYQPNQGALNAYPGTAHCGTYGNRNFWRFFNEWFGSPLGDARMVSNLEISRDGQGNTFTGMITARFTIRNNTDKTVDLGKIGVASVSPSGRTDGFRMKSVVVHPHTSYEYIDTQKFTEEGDHRFWVVGLSENCQYCTSVPQSAHAGIVRARDVFVTHQPTLIRGIRVASSSRTTVGEELQLQYRIKNNSRRSLKLGSLGYKFIHQSGKNVGMAMMNSVVLAPQEERVIAGKRTIPQVGVYTATVLRFDGMTWDEGFLKGLNEQRVLSVDAKTPLSLLSTPTLSLQPRVGQQVSAAFKLHNFSSKRISQGKIGLAVYDPQGRSVGFAMQDLTIEPNSTLTYNVPPRTFRQPGRYTAVVVHYHNGQWKDWTDTESPDVKGRMAFEVGDTMTVQVTPALSVKSPRVREAVKASFSIKNYSSYKISEGKIGLAVYDPQGRSVGFAMQDLTIEPGGTLTYQVPMRSFSIPGVYRAQIVQFKDGRWYDYGRKEQGASVNFSFAVKSDISLLSTPTLSLQPRVGQQVSAAFKLHNFSSKRISQGKIGLAVYDPQGRSVGFAIQDLTIEPNSTLTYNVPPRTFRQPGRYTAVVVHYHNGQWKDWTDTESPDVKGRMAFEVKP